MKYSCPCCGNKTFPVPANEAVAYICPVCFWENDVFIQSIDEESDENSGMTLRTARENYIKFGAVNKKFINDVRKPFPDEIPDENSPYDNSFHPVKIINSKEKTGNTAEKKFYFPQNKNICI